ncbi:MAG: AMP-binding protein [Sedimenticolaceae bacterium]|nr:AMP-binding protein [Sedimenticolaceae bacterium]
MDKIWLKRYPAYVPAEIDVSTYHSLVDVYRESVEKFRDRPAYENLGRTLTYGEFDQLVTQFATYLTSILGLSRGDRIAIMMPNLLQYPIALFAAIRAGLIVVNTNPLYTARELRHQLNDSGAVAIVVLENFAHTLEKIISETPLRHVITTSIGDMAGFPKSLLINFVVRHVRKMVPPWSIDGAVRFRDTLTRRGRHSFEDADLGHDDIAFLQYTGGTTGVAKGAMLTHKNVIANLLQAHAWTANDLVPGKEIFITALPMYHIFALLTNALFAMQMGAKNRLITNPRDLPALIKELSREPFSFITGVNTLFNAMLHAPGFEKLDFSRLKIVLGGGMAVQRAVADPWQKITGTTLLEAYGLTETAPAAAINPLDIDGYNGSIGLPIPSTEISIRDENNEELPYGERGELCIRGPQVMQGYWQRPEETAAAIDEDGWFHSGDIATMNEEGFVYIVDRLKDMILVSGFNVYPNEVEEVLAAHPGVLEAGVIGVSDEKSTEAVRAIVVPKDGSLTEKELHEYARENLSAYKCPKSWVFVDELPKSNVGKILRRELREMYGK